MIMNQTMRTRLKAGVVTPYGLFNYGNRLQAYAVWALLNRCGVDAEEVVFPAINKQTGFKQTLKPLVYGTYNNSIQARRFRSFREFDNKIPKRFFKKEVNLLNAGYDYAIIGSDQIWNPNSIEPTNAVFGKFVDSDKRVCISPSFGIERLGQKWEGAYKKGLQDLGHLSVREDAGRTIIKELVGRDAIVLADPTFSISADEWTKVSRHDYVPDKNYIFVYILSNTPAKYLDEVFRIADRESYCIVNIMDRKSKYYGTGPQDFISLIGNASLVCTDSFHAAAFSLIFSRPFKVFSRIGPKSMNSRIRTLSSQFGLNWNDDGSVLIDVSDRMLADIEREGRISELSSRMHAFLDNVLCIKSKGNQG